MIRRRYAVFVFGISLGAMVVGGWACMNATPKSLVMPKDSEVKTVEVELFRAPFPIDPISKTEVDISEYRNIVTVLDGATRSDVKMRDEDRIGLITLSLIDGGQVKIDYYWTGKGGVFVAVEGVLFYVDSAENRDLGYLLSERLSKAVQSKK